MSTSIPSTERRQAGRLAVILVLIGSFFVVELVGARIARSEGLKADAFHLLMDVVALAISLVSLRVASRRPSERFTFGLRRAEPLAALANGILVLGVALELVRDGIEHIQHTSDPRWDLMLAFSTAALVVNGINAWLLHGVMPGHSHGHDHSHDRVHDPSHGHGHEHHHGHHLNLRGAWLHLMGDALGSVAAFAAGLAIRFGAPPLVDPLACFFVVAILAFGALRLLRDAGLVLLDAAPRHLPVRSIERALLDLDDVTRVGALHVWSLGTGHDAISARVGTTSNDPTLGRRVSAALRARFNVEYVTIEVEVE